MGLGLQNPIIVYDKNGNGLQVRTDDEYNAALAMGYLPVPAASSTYPKMLYLGYQAYIVGSAAEESAAVSAGYTTTPPVGVSGGFVTMSATVAASVAQVNAARSSRNGGKIPGW